MGSAFFPVFGGWPARREISDTRKRKFEREGYATRLAESDPVCDCEMFFQALSVLIFVVLVRD